ncbi:MAG: alkaline phosphatase D family protein [Acidimicrobiales bacterium]
MDNPAIPGTGASRRRFLGMIGGAALATTCSSDESPAPASTSAPDSTTSETAATSTSTEAPTTAAPVKTPGSDGITADPFTLGVASGDPWPTSVVLWTRLAPEPTTGNGGMPDQDYDVLYELSLDDGFDADVQAGRGLTTADAAHHHSVHVEVGELAPATSYWYRFRVGDWVSPIGRTRTAPAANSRPDTVRVAVASCQAYMSGYYGAHRHLAAEELDAVLFVGDYIYEREAGSFEPRAILLEGEPAPVPFNLEQYRHLYSVYKQDPDLQAAHAAHPWIITWDDHEVEDNYADNLPGGIGVTLGESTPENFPPRRAAAYQAWWENLPIRGPAPTGGDIVIHRALDFGGLVRLAIVDDRQYRSPIAEGPGGGALPRGFGGGPLLAESFDEDRTMLGFEQEQWLTEVLSASEAAWTVLVQQTVMAEVDRAPDDPDLGFSMDAWDGYVAARERLLATVREQVADGGFISLGGDIHSGAVTDLYDTYRGDDRTLVGTEFVAPSITSIELLQPGFLEGARANPHIHHYEPDRRGYLLVDFDAGEARAAFRYIDDAENADTGIETASSWQVNRGVPGVVET